MAEDGFLGRWSRRKLDARQGRPPEPEPAAPATGEGAAPAPLPPPLGEGGGGGTRAESISPGAAPTLPSASGGGEETPPTLADVQALTPESDFTRFVSAEVAPEVKNAALRKLFADPHFNVMDGLDVYIDDYSRPDPLPESMARQLASAEFLGLLREDPAAQIADAATREAADAQAPRSVAQSQPPGSQEPGEDGQAADEGGPVAEGPSHDADPDLRLQQDHAAGPPGPGQGPR